MNRSAEMCHVTHSVRTPSASGLGRCWLALVACHLRVLAEQPPCEKKMCVPFSQAGLTPCCHTAPCWSSQTPGGPDLLMATYKHMHGLVSPSMPSNSRHAASCLGTSRYCIRQRASVNDHVWHKRNTSLFVSCGHVFRPSGSWKGPLQEQGQHPGQYSQGSEV